MVYEALGCTNNEGDDTSANKSECTSSLYMKYTLNSAEKNVVLMYLMDMLGVMQRSLKNQYTAYTRTKIKATAQSYPNTCITSKLIIKIYESKNIVSSLCD